MDRSRLIHNPNHPPPRPSPSAFSYPHPVAQPAADPFPRRLDPFIVSTSTEKRDAPYAHAHYATNGAPRMDPFQPAPPPPPSPYHSRRSSVGGAYSSGPLEPPPPPPLPAVLTRQMPPPASSPKQSPAPSYSHPLSRTQLPTPSSYGSSRDPTPSYAGNRPSSSMSIQSMMATESGGGTVQRPPQWQPSYSTRAPPSSGPFPLPPSPSTHDRRFGLHNNDSSESGRPRTPERRAEQSFVGAFARPGMGMSPAAHAASQGATPDQNNHGFARLYQQPAQPSPGPGLPPRPFSQPTGFEPINRGQGYRPPYDPVPQPLHPGQRPPMDRFDLEHRQQDGLFEKTFRDRAVSDLDGRRVNPSGQPYSRPLHEQVSFSNGATSLSDPPFSARRHEYQPGPPKSDGPQEVFQFEHPADHHVRRPASPPATHSASSLGQNKPGMNFGPIFMQAEHAASKPHAEQQDPPQSTFAITDTNHTPLIDAQLRRSIEETQAQQRAYLNIVQEHNRRQASPLPQAVQGAQSQPVGSGRDPGIKSEFGRMFSGLGSGVGSTPQPVPSSVFGPPTPAPRSPVVETGEGMRSARRTSEGSREPLNGTRGGRKGKRIYDDDTKLGSDSGDGGITPVGSVRGNKRNKYTLPGHHHHHHPLVPHHHHHHPKLNEEAPAQTTGRRSSGTPFNTFKFPAATTSASTATPVPHHHHHHLPPHHHHHPPKSGPAPQAPPVRLPTTTILTKPLLSSIAHIPRRHLGSQLYAPTVHLPSTTASTLDSRHTYTLIPNLLPRFEGRENCTFTVRVPRYYLTQRSRESICSARRVWGTDVYTDDSDPVAAAIHSGWIRGAWGADVDVELLGLSTPVPASTGTNDKGVAARASADSETVDGGAVFGAKRLTEPPPSPVVPPDDVDLHLTLLVLPPLEKYASSVWYGVKSRSWGSNHDGMSFKIERLEWVNEGVEGRGEERGGAAKKKRMAEVIKALVAANGNAVVRGTGSSGGKASRSGTGSGRGKRKGNGVGPTARVVAQVA